MTTAFPNLVNLTTFRYRVRHFLTHFYLLSLLHEVDPEFVLKRLPL